MNDIEFIVAEIAVVVVLTLIYLVRDHIRRTAGSPAGVSLEGIDISKYIIDGPALTDLLKDVEYSDTQERTFVPGLGGAHGTISGFHDESKRLFGDDPPRHLTMDIGRRWWQLRRRTGYFGDCKITDTDSHDAGERIEFTVDFEMVGPMRTVRAWTKRGLARKIRKAEGAT